MGHYVPTEWVDGQRFLKILLPHLQEHNAPHGHKLNINETPLDSRERDFDVVRRLQRHERKRVSVDTAERILVHVGLDVHILDDAR